MQAGTVVGCADRVARSWCAFRLFGGLDRGLRAETSEQEPVGSGAAREHRQMTGSMGYREVEMGQQWPESPEGERGAPCLGEVLALVEVSFEWNRRMERIP